MALNLKRGLSLYEYFLRLKNNVFKRLITAFIPHGEMVEEKNFPQLPKTALRGYSLKRVEISYDINSRQDINNLMDFLIQLKASFPENNTSNGPISTN